jgi:hypothetical protein
MMHEARPFNQSETQSDGKRLAIGRHYSGRAYRFRLLLPVDANGMERFSDDEVEWLEELFFEDFGGSTRSTGAVAPTVAGSYWSDSGAKLQDGHIAFDIYTLQSQGALLYFRELCANLERHSRDVVAPRVALRRPADGYIGEEKILAELAETRLL